ncbi:hypothetical protein ABZ471_12010 [Streptomyces sp. NPDC005728]|uniref:hypothetical protein n=1 Tax=Streptomyces sp. NPDC005728 TaxID=3157054 RepID=UPI0033F4A6E5
MYHRTGQDVLRDVVRRVAPDELEKLDATCRAYLARPHPPQRLHRPAGDPLGIGFESAVVLPVLVAVVSQVLADLASGRIQAGGTRLKRWWRHRRGADTEGRRAALTSPVPELSEVTRQELADWAIAQGRTAGLSAPRAETCAQIIVVAVVRGNAGPQSDESPDTGYTTRRPMTDGSAAAAARDTGPRQELGPEPAPDPDALAEPEPRTAPAPRTPTAGAGDEARASDGSGAADEARPSDEARASNEARPSDQARARLRPEAGDEAGAGLRPEAGDAAAANPSVS